MKSISSKKLKGNILIPGDKSISHRLVILSSIAIGHSNINGILKILPIIIPIIIESIIGEIGLLLKFNTSLPIMRLKYMPVYAMMKLNSIPGKILNIDNCIIKHPL